MENEATMMTLKEASRYLSVKESYMYKLVHWKKIPYYKPGGKLLYFSKSELMEYINRGRVSSESEIDRIASQF